MHAKTPSNPLSGETSESLKGLLNKINGNFDKMEKVLKGEPGGLEKTICFEYENTNQCRYINELF